jgi:tRNAHis guanylyltransferase
VTQESKVDDALGDRMKGYESAEAGRRLMPLVPVMARIDGRCFSSFTRGMRRPYDPTMSEAMIDTTVQLVKETNACMGYTQSDEITLAWHSTDPKSHIRKERPDVKYLVSYADPSVGHRGQIYKAANWKSDGLTDDERKSPRFDYACADTGKKYSRRGHVPDHVTIKRVPRISKHRFVYAI